MIVKSEGSDLFCVFNSFTNYYIKKKFFLFQPVSRRLVFSRKDLGRHLGPNGARTCLERGPDGCPVNTFTNGPINVFPLSQTVSGRETL